MNEIYIADPQDRLRRFINVHFVNVCKYERYKKGEHLCSPFELLFLTLLSEELFRFAHIFCDLVAVGANSFGLGVIDRGNRTIYLSHNISISFFGKGLVAITIVIHKRTHHIADIRHLRDGG